MADGNRIQDYWPMSRHVHALATAPAVLDTLRELYGREPRPFQTLNRLRSRIGRLRRGVTG